MKLLCFHPYYGEELLALGEVNTGRVLWGEEQTAIAFMLLSGNCILQRNRIKVHLQKVNVIITTMCIFNLVLEEKKNYKCSSSLSLVQNILVKISQNRTEQMYS